jgi:excinuclease UvrABC nuclease subunit
MPYEILAGQMIDAANAGLEHRKREAWRILRERMKVIQNEMAFEMGNIQDQIRSQCRLPATHRQVT